MKADSRRIIDVDEDGRVERVARDDEHAVRERLQQLAWLLDSSIPIPGTRFTIGIDALIGLLPFIGDMIGVLLSSFILGEAARLGAPRSVLLRMAANVGVEGTVGIIPFAGDVFDAAFKANQRNVRLLEAWMDSPRRVARSSRLLAFGIGSGIAALLVLLVAAAILLVRWIAGLF
jgi:hypothetical protein